MAAIIKANPAEIVRQHRVEMLKRINIGEVKKRLEDEGNGVSNNSPFPPLNAPQPPLNLRGGKGELKWGWGALVHAVNWDVAFDWLCTAGLAGCLIYLVIFVIGPFAMRYLWK